MANGQAGDGSRFENNGAASSLGERDEVDDQREIGKGNQEDGGEGDGYDEESYEEDEFDEDEGGDTENERANRSDEGIGEVAHRKIGRQEEDSTDGGGDVNDEHNEHADGDAIERMGNQQAGSAGGSGGSTHDAQNVTHSNRALCQCKVSEIPVYLCGGGEVSMFQRTNPPSCRILRALCVQCIMCIRRACYIISSTVCLDNKHTPALL